MIKADLHTHTRFSDGSDRIVALLDRAVASGVSVLSITDHDTPETYAHAIDLAKKREITLIPGIEFSAYDPEVGKKVHILGYGYGADHPHITALGDEMLSRRNAQSERFLQILLDHGYDLDLSALGRSENSHKTLYKNHLMSLLSDEPYTGSGYQETYRTLFKNSGILSEDTEYLHYADAIEAVQKDGAMPFLAHPGQQGHFDRLQTYVDAGLEGIETYHQSHGAEDVAKALAGAKKYNLLVSGGSDYHGSNGRAVELGDYSTPEETVKAILERMKRNGVI